MDAGSRRPDAGADAGERGARISGVISGTAPAFVLIPANVVLGVMIGARFSHFTFTEFREALKEGFSGFLIALAIALAGAGITSAVSGLPLALTLLAFSPGGLDAMTIMAFALNLDPAYVGAHQMARYIGLALLMPMVTAYVLGRMGVAAKRRTRPALETQGPLMDQLAFLLTYKGAVVLGTLAVLLVAERLFPMARVVGGVRRVARNLSLAGSMRCCPGRWWCRLRPSPPRTRWAGGRSGGAAGRACARPPDPRLLDLLVAPRQP